MVRPPKLHGMGDFVNYAAVGAAGGGAGGGNNPAPGPAKPQSAFPVPAVMMPGYAGQCVVFENYVDPQTGARINLRVRMPTGETRVFATEQEYQQACFGPAPGVSYPGVPSGYIPPPQAPVYTPQPSQTINVSVPGPSAPPPPDYSALWAALFAKDTQAPAVTSAPPPIATQMPTSYTYVPGAPDGGVAYAPSQDQPQPTITPAPESAPATPWWLWAGIGAAALYAMKGRLK